MFEDIAIAFMLGFAAAGGGGAPETLVLVAKALLFITAGVAASLARSTARPPARPALARVLPPRRVRFPRSDGGPRGELGLSEAIGALMAGIVLSETSIRDQIEERFFSFRDIFAALFFFVFGLSIDVSALGDVGWIVAIAVIATLFGKIGAGWIAGRLGGFTSRQGFNAGVALVAHGEFTIILAQIASGNSSIDADARTDLVAFAGSTSSSPRPSASS